MKNKTLIQTLDAAIEKSELALGLIDEQDWEGFIETQEQRQQLIASLETQTFDNNSETIERLTLLTSLNKKLLEKTQNHHNNIEAALKKYHKVKSAKKAYQQ